MNLLWAGMMLAAVVYGALHGTMPQVTQAAIDSSKEAVMLFEKCKQALRSARGLEWLMALAVIAALALALLRWC